jgi:membrane protein YdbS with pleckstrin-like domain
MKPGDPECRHALLSLRSAFVLSVALVIAICAGVLLFYVHHSVPLAVLGAGATFAGAVTLVNVLVELQQQLNSRPRPGRMLRCPTCRRAVTPDCTLA